MLTQTAISVWPESGKKYGLDPSWIWQALSNEAFIIKLSTLTLFFTLINVLTVRYTWND